jgi:hypothetical protein
MKLCFLKNVGTCDGKWDGKMVVIISRIWKEAVVAYLKVLPGHLPRETEEKQQHS